METRIKVETALNDYKRYWPQYKNLIGLWNYFKEYDGWDYTEVVRESLEDAKIYINEKIINVDYVKYP